MPAMQKTWRPPDMFTRLMQIDRQTAAEKLASRRLCMDFKQGCHLCVALRVVSSLVRE